MKKAIIAFVASVLIAAPAFAATTDATKGEFGNHCAYGLTMGKQVMTDCKINWVDKGKTYCFSSEEAKANFAKDAAANVKKAEEGFAKASAGTTHDAHATKEEAHKSM